LRAGLANKNVGNAFINPVPPQIASAPRDLNQEIAQMKSSTLRDMAASPLGVPLDLLTEQGTESRP